MMREREKIRLVSDSAERALTPLTPTPHSIADWLVDTSEMAKLVRAKDWSKTPLGPIESWPQSLRTTVSLCLASNFPISVVWGPRHIQIYNDGYWPICGAKHPDSLGQDFTECWAAPWPVIGDSFERALAGTTSFLEDQRMFLDRHGYLEETFFTFSFSPIRDESGGVGGLFHPVTETTSKIIGERRTRTLRDLAAGASKAQTSDDAFRLAAQALADSAFDLPFALFYVVDTEGAEVRLAGSAGAPDAVVASSISLRSEESLWPLAEVLRTGRAQQVDGLRPWLAGCPCGPYPEPPQVALVFPITPPGCERPSAMLIAGVSPRLPLNEGYRAFLDLVAAGVTTAVANARAHEEERRRAEALAESDRAKTAFFSNVSHEFRTPLTLMLGPLQDEIDERQSPLPPARRERLETAHRNSLRLLKLVNTLLDFSRVESDRVQANFVPLDLAAHTSELSGVFRSAIERAGLKLTVDCPPLPELMYVDREMWEKTLLNLLSNAFKHTFRGGIRVGLAWFGDHAELSVSDTGVGISEAELPRLFERFHRVTGARSRTHEGTGIGLALVKQLVSIHDGRIQVESREGQGTTFTIAIKSGTAHLPAERIGAKPAQPTSTRQADGFLQEALQWARDSSPPPSGGFTGALSLSALAAATRSVAGQPAQRSRILVADDNVDMRDYLRRLLSVDNDVLAVADGVAALAAVPTHQPELVLSDVMMPRLDGFGLLRELRARPETQSLPVILLSARAGEDSAVDGLNAGADDYLAKPFSARELLARVRTHLELSRVRKRWAEEKQLREAHQRAEEAIRQSEETHRLLFEDSPVAAYVMDVETSRLLAVNQAALALYGYSREEFLALRMHDLRDPEDAADLAELQRAAGDGDLSVTARHSRKDGSVLHVEGKHHLSTFEGRRARFVVVNDVSARKEAEAGLTRAQDALRQTEEQLRQSQKMEAIGRLAGGVAHDFNNLLSVILSYSELMLGNLRAGDPMRAEVTQVHQAGTRAAELTRQLLIFSRQQVLEPKVLDLNDVLQGMDSLLRRLVGEDVDLVSTPGAVSGNVRVDPGSIEQVIMNLVVNARDAMPTGGQLTIETANVVLDEAYTKEHLGVTVGEYVLLAVTDTGMGMDRATQARIFEPFFTTKATGKGTGLGLSTVFGIVQQSGGSVWVYSELGSGTSFKVYLPQVAGPVDELAPETASKPPNGTETVLLVEDEEQVRNVARGILERHGYHVLEALNGADALRVAASYSGSIDLLLSDVVMPVMSGPELAKRLAAQRPTTRILCMSGYTDDAVIRHGAVEAGIAFIQKPFTPQTLTRKIREVLA